MRAVSLSEALHLIKTRRSIFEKDFTGKRVPESIIEKMLEGANWAPTHGKTEPWRFVIVSGEALRNLGDVIAEETESKLEKESEEWHRFVKRQTRRVKERKNISHSIAICMKRVKSRKGKFMPEWEDSAAVACAVQNMHLIATAAGVAGYWSSSGVCGGLNSEKVKKILGLSGEGDKCMGFFNVGLSDRISKYKAFRKPWEDKVTWLRDLKLS
ncbi:hypothetical protein AAMO2058_001086800 [Amorphochlora amoebiformis]